LKFSYKASAEIFDDSIIKIKEEMADVMSKCTKTVIDTREQAVIHALEKLGWLAPEFAAELVAECDYLRNRAYEAEAQHVQSLKDSTVAALSERIADLQARNQTLQQERHHLQTRLSFLESAHTQSADGTDAAHPTFAKPTK
jgi:hypothetical protein